MSENSKMRAKLLPQHLIKELRVFSPKSSAKPKQPKRVGIVFEGE